MVKVTQAALRAWGRLRNVWPLQERSAILSVQSAGSGA